MRLQPSDRPPRISLFLDIGQGAGLAGATGVRPFLPPLVAGAFARTDIGGLDFDGTDYRFLESPGFLLGVLALAVVAYALGRSGAYRGREADVPAGGGPLERILGALALALGALLFAGALADGGHESWPGLLAGVACAALGFAASAALFGRVRRRLDPAAAALLPLYGDAAALLIAGLSVLAPPVGLLALALFAWLALAERSRAGGKYEGLRILR